MCASVSEKNSILHHILLSVSHPSHAPATNRADGAEIADYDLCAACHASNAGIVGQPMWAEVPVTERRRTSKTGVAQLLFDAMHNYQDRWCLGTRSADGEYQWMTYAELARRVRSFRAGMQRAEIDGLKLQRRSLIGLAAAVNSADWIVADIACFACGLISVPIHLPSSSSFIAAIVEEGQIEVVVCTTSAAEQLRSLHVSGRCTSLKTMVCTGPRNQQALVRAGTSSGIRVLDFAEVEASGSRHCIRVADDGDAASSGSSGLPELGPDDLVTIMYTSGSSGRPKGAMLSAAVMARRIGGASLSPDPLVTISYMPPAHSFERVSSLQTIATGGRLAFHVGGPSDLLETFARVRPAAFSRAQKKSTRFQCTVSHLLI